MSRGIMISEVVIPFFTEGMGNTLVVYRDYQTKDGYGDQFLEVIDRIASVGGYPIDTGIDVRTSVGLCKGSGDSVTVRMKTVVFV